MYNNGDILIDSWFAGHTILCCSKAGEMYVAEILADGVKFRPATKLDANIYRCHNKNLADKAADYMTSWCDPASGHATTPFAVKGIPTGRYYGWISQVKSGVTLPFEHDALYRAFKWASRIDRPISFNKGITCAFFVVAAYQAAAIDLIYSGDIATIKAKALMLGAGRSEAKKTHDGQHERWSTLTGTSVENSVLPRYSNVGPLPNQSAEFFAHWKSVLGDAPNCPVKLEDVFTQAMLVDAKYDSSPALEDRLKTDGVNWQELLRPRTRPHGAAR